ncbi:MAG: hypothetical protein DRP70_17335 [Spirochaetes bacterium]|nr:MAG: hypothetical protein DRP70_17335 [Spirochaetota bacterium]
MANVVFKDVRNTTRTLVSQAYQRTGTDAAVKAELDGRVTVINSYVQGHINATLGEVRKVTSRGFSPGNKPLGSRVFSPQVAGVKRGSIGRIQLDWPQLSAGYLRSKSKRTSPGKNRFWNRSGDLGRAMAGVPDVKVTSRLRLRKNLKSFKAGEAEYEVDSFPSNLPEPLQSLVRRAFLNGASGNVSEALSGATISGGLEPILYLEVSGSGTSRIKRPFIEKLAVNMGRLARQRIKNLGTN